MVVALQYISYITTLPLLRMILTRLHTPKRATSFKPKAGINEILICMNYHDLNDKLNCNFHTFRPVIPFGFLLSLFCWLGAAEPSHIKDLMKTRGFSIKKVVDHG